jgi:hypothetical protein
MTTMSKILVPTNSADDWRTLLADPIKHWKIGYSAYATAQCWEAENGFPPEIAEILGSKTELLLAIPEHKVPLPGGSRDSQCDVFALGRVVDKTIAVSVEGKVDETFGPTIGEWHNNPSDGKIKRLTSICETLGLQYPPQPELRYQLFHRTAAAVIEAQRFGTDQAAMIVHSFSQEHRWFDDFSLFCELFGVKARRGVGHRVNLPDGQQLVLGWATGHERFLSEVI